MNDAQTLLLLGTLAMAYGAFAWRRRRRNAALLGELGEALRLAAEAQRCHWRLHRRYTAELEELARLRRALFPFLDGSRHGGRTRWALGASDDGQTFELTIVAKPHLLMARGDHGTIAYDSHARDGRSVPRLQPVEVA